MLICSLYPRILSRSGADGDASHVKTDNILSRDLPPSINTESDLFHNDASNDSSQSDCGVKQNAVGMRNMSPYLSPQLLSTDDVELLPTPADDMWLVELPRLFTINLVTSHWSISCENETKYYVMSKNLMKFFKNCVSV